MVNSTPPMFIEAFITNPAVEALDVGVLIGFSGRDELMFDLVGVGPLIQSGTCELRTIISE